MPDYHSKREKELKEIDMYDVMIPELAIPYHNRLQGASDFLDMKMNYRHPGSKDVRRYLLNESGLAEGEKNFWSNPYDAFPKQTPTDIRALSYNFPVIGAVTGNLPTTVQINPKLGYENAYPAASLIPHEALHTSQTLADIRKGFGEIPMDYSYKPRFSNKFLKELQKIQETKKDSPYYLAGGFGFDLDETMSYFYGREGNLPKGQTLKDDPATKHLWRAYPGMYEEYVRARDSLKKVIP